jgi:hypothetical protein
MQQQTHLLDAIGCRDRRLCEQLVVGECRELGLGWIAAQSEAALFERAQRLLEALGERAADRHHLADRLHLGAEDARGAGQLLERPAGILVTT